MNQAFAHIGNFRNYIVARKLATQMRRIIKKEGVEARIETKKMIGGWDVKLIANDEKMTPFDIQKTAIRILSIILQR